jgi:hypothetical protein
MVQRVAEKSSISADKGEAESPLCPNGFFRARRGFARTMTGFSGYLFRDQSKKLTRRSEPIIIHPYFRHVDTIRFFCAIMVMSFHFCYIDSVANYRMLWPFMWFGWVGVEVFFVFSGVVIANSAHGATAKSLRGVYFGSTHPHGSPLQSF